MKETNKIRVKVVMLATNNTVINGVQIIKNNQTNELRIPITGAELRRIVAGSAVWKAQHLYLVSDEEIQVGDYAYDSIDIIIHKVIFTEDNSYINQGWFKVIATTDTTLNLPLIPQSFVEKYVKVNGKIEEVEIETTSSELEYVTSRSVAVTKNNEVIISQPKETWTRNEVEHLLKELHYQCCLEYPIVLNCDMWIKGNL